MAYIPGMAKSDSPENWLNNHNLLKSEFVVNAKSIEINGKTLDRLYKEWCGTHHTVNSNKPIHDSDECIDFAWYCLKVALEELKP